MSSVDRTRIRDRLRRKLSQGFPKRLTRVFGKGFQWLGLAVFSFCLFISSLLFHSSQVPAFSSVLPAGAPRTVPLRNQARYSYSDVATDQAFGGGTNALQSLEPLIDPLGRLLGCGGQPLSDYRGFTMALYEADAQGTEPGALVALTPTAPRLESSPFGSVLSNDVLSNSTSSNSTFSNNLLGNSSLGNSSAPVGLAPNLRNRNPFSLTSTGRYNFLLDPNRGQAEIGKSYILVIAPPSNSIYAERRIKLTIQSIDAAGKLSYRATALDGKPLAIQGSSKLDQDSVTVRDAETTGIDLASIQFPLVLCPAEPVSVSKSASQATAESGDIVLYRLTVRNQSDVPLTELKLIDRLPQGLELVEDSVQAAIAKKSVEITTTLEQGPKTATATLAFGGSLAPQAILNLFYAVRVTPSAVRGSGLNSVVVLSQREDNRFALQDGPAIHSLSIRPGITSDCGLLLGRVFDDLNFDGEQQRGEPGMANAVIYLQDGNRVVTDENGLFSVANALPGHYVGVLDLSTVPGYRLALNQYRREFNSGSRLVRLAPSGMARMNFPVMPLNSTAEEIPESSQGVTNSAVDMDANQDREGQS